MPSSAPPNLVPTEPETDGDSPETVQSGIHPAEAFVKAVADSMKPIRIDIARTLGKRKKSEPEVEIWDDSEVDGMPSEAVLAKLAQSRKPDDFIAVIDMMFEEDDKRKGKFRKPR